MRAVILTVVLTLVAEAAQHPAYAGDLTAQQRVIAHAGAELASAASGQYRWYGYGYAIVRPPLYYGAHYRPYVYRGAVVSYYYSPYVYVGYARPMYYVPYSYTVSAVAVQPYYTYPLGYYRYGYYAYPSYYYYAYPYSYRRLYYRYW
jgi:hypothetical protein